MSGIAVALGLIFLAVLVCMAYFGFIYDEGSKDFQHKRDYNNAFRGAPAWFYDRGWQEQNRLEARVQDNLRNQKRR